MSNYRHWRAGVASEKALLPLRVVPLHAPGAQAGSVDRECSVTPFTPAILMHLPVHEQFPRSRRAESLPVFLLGAVDSMPTGGTGDACSAVGVIVCVRHALNRNHGAAAPVTRACCCVVPWERMETHLAHPPSSSSVPYDASLMDPAGIAYTTHKAPRHASQQSGHNVLLSNHHSMQPEVVGRSEHGAPHKVDRSFSLRPRLKSLRQIMGKTSSVCRPSTSPWHGRQRHKWSRKERSRLVSRCAQAKGHH